MSGKAIQAVQQFTKSGVGSRTSVVKEITIGITLGLAAGLTWKVGRTTHTNPCAGQLLLSWGPCQQEPQSCRFRCWQHYRCRPETGPQPLVPDARHCALLRLIESSWPCFRSQTWHWNEKRKISEYYDTLEQINKQKGESLRLLLHLLCGGSAGVMFDVCNTAAAAMQKISTFGLICCASCQLQQARRDRMRRRRAALGGALGGGPGRLGGQRHGALIEAAVRLL